MDRRVLLVEGKDEVHTFSALFQAHQIPVSFKIVDAGGIDALLESIPVRLKASDLERFAVVIDADERLQQRWDQFKDRLHAFVAAEIPEQPTSTGTVIQFRDGPKMGVWIMPNNQIPGMLETFLAFLVSDTDDLLPLVDLFLTSIPKDKRRCPEHRQPKARIHSWLALQNEPGKPLGQAVTAKYLDAHVPVVKPFLDWIKIMFVD